MPMEVPEVRYGRQMTATSPALLTPARMNGQYSWTLNIYPKVSEVCQYLRQELTKVSGEVVAARFEPATNVFLLCCAISDTADDSMLGTGYDFSKIGNAFGAAGPAIGAFDKIVSYRRRWRELRSAALVKWRKLWQAGVEAYVHDWLLALGSDLDVRVKELQKLLRDVPFSKDLLGTRIRVPAAFRSLDLTPFDVLSLGRAYAQQVRNSTVPILVVGLRTVGSYFAPILTAYLRSQGHRQVVSLTIRPRKGLGPAEQKALLHWAKKGAIAAIIDEPVNTGSKFRSTVDILRTAGFSPHKISVLAPTHPQKGDWSADNDELGLAAVRVVTLEPKDWYRQQQFQPDHVEQRLQSCFLEQGYKSAVLVNGDAVEQLNRSLRLSEQPFSSRMKQIYEFQLKDSAGRTRTVYVHAKSVGWGWLSYHSLITASRLPAFVPPVLGLDGGILYTEWLPQATDPPGQPDRYSLIGEISLYVAARARTLRLDESLAADLSRDNRHKGFEILAGALSGVYGSKSAAFLKRARIYHALSQQPCPFPTFIDGKMRTSEWILSPGSQSLKTDFEHHGLGETELNVTDPAYDLADAILQFGMSRLEEARLLSGYRLSSGDNDIGERLMLYKILAGLRMMDAASETLSYPGVPHKHETCNQQYVNARRLLTIHTARHCAKWMNKPPEIQWTSPLVVLDIDGILDKQIIGFPSTTPAAIRALSLLHTHGISTIVNTARTAAEVKEYCDTFQFLGGIAEHGSIIYDAVSRRWRPLVSNESLAQIDAVRDALRRIPGVFVDDAYQYSLRAYAYERGATVPIHASTIQRVMVTLGADQLAYHQTCVDTAVVAREVDKGKSLTAYMDFIGKADLSTIAVGDSRKICPCFAPRRVHSHRLTFPALTSQAHWVVRLSASLTKKVSWRSRKGLFIRRFEVRQVPDRQESGGCDRRSAARVSDNGRQELAPAPGSVTRPNVHSQLCDIKDA